MWALLEIGKLITCDMPHVNTIGCSFARPAFTLPR